MPRSCPALRWILGNNVRIPKSPLGNHLQDGTFFVMAQSNVNNDDRGCVDFQKIIGLDEIALINIVFHPFEASVSGRKTIGSRITQYDGKLSIVFHFLLLLTSSRARWFWGDDWESDEA